MHRRDGASWLTAWQLIQRHREVASRHVVVAAVEVVPALSQAARKLLSRRHRAVRAAGGALSRRGAARGSQRGRPVSAPSVARCSSAGCVQLGVAFMAADRARPFEVGSWPMLRRSAALSLSLSAALSPPSGVSSAAALPPQLPQPPQSQPFGGWTDRKMSARTCRGTRNPRRPPHAGAADAQPPAVVAEPRRLREELRRAAASPALDRNSV